MDNTLGIIFETVILVFNLLIFMQLTVPTRDTALTRGIMYGGSVLILALFFVCTRLEGMSQALSSFLFVTLPTFTLFFTLSKYKDFRFLVTFCFLDTLTLITVFFVQAADILGGHVVGGIVGGVLVVGMIIVYIKGRPLFRRYRSLLRNVKNGWGALAVSTLAIYLLLVFSASYPKPLIERPAYLLSYAMLAVTLLTVYVVFVLSLIQRATLSDLNAQLISEKKWHKIAYEDALTGLKNRMAYIERINDLERVKNDRAAIHAVMIDIDNFKHINDSLGHHFGDKTLQQTAEYLRFNLPKNHYTVFRIGGDEFAVIAVDLTDAEVADTFDRLLTDCTASIGCSVSYGICRVNPDVNRAIEIAFETADRRMYEQKSNKIPV